MVNDLLVRLGGGGGIGQNSGFSHESEHDVAMMVTDFLENGEHWGRVVVQQR